MTREIKRHSSPFWGAGLLLCGVSFALWFWILASSARLNADDFCTLGTVRKLGVWGSVISWWDGWTGRWAGKAVISLVASLVAPTARIQVFVLLTGLFLCGAVWFFIHRAWRRGPFRPLPLYFEALLALFFVALFYQTCRVPRELFFWLEGSVFHLWPLCFALLILGFLLSPRLAAWEIGVAFVLCALFSGFGECTWAALIFLLGTALCIKARRGQIGSRRMKTFALALAILVITGIGTALAPGNRARFESSHASTSPWLRLVNVAHNSVHTVKALAVENSMAPFLALLLGFGVASVACLDKPDRASGRRAWKSQLQLITGFGFLTLVATAPAALGIDGPVPARSWAPIVAALLVLCFVSGALWGTVLNGKFTRLPSAVLLVIVPLWPAALFASSFRNERAPLALAVAGFDANYAYLQTRREGCAGTLVVPKLPDQKWVLLGEPMPDEKHWISTCQRDGMGLPCPLRRNTFSYVAAPRR